MSVELLIGVLTGVAALLGVLARVGQVIDKRVDSAREAALRDLVQLRRDLNGRIDLVNGRIDNVLIAALPDRKPEDYK